MSELQTQELMIEPDAGLPIDPGDEVFTKITRYQVILECIRFMEGIKKSFSRAGNYQKSLPGYEMAFDAVSSKIEILQDLLYEAQYGKKRDIHAEGRTEYDSC